MIEERKEPKVFMVHGFEGVPNGGWRPWLMAKLALEDIYACSLPMPKPFTPSREEWIAELNHAIGTPSEDVYLVGHSLGVPAILQYIQSLPLGSKIGGAVLVSGPFRNVEDEHRDVLKSFFEPALDIEKIKGICGQFTVIHGDNDRVVQFSDAEKLSTALECTLVSIPNGGHLNGGSGHRELQSALDALLGFIRK